MTFKPDIHADDYGYSLNTSKDILDCMKDGYLNSISIICNMPSFEESMDMLYEEIKNLPFLPLISVHLNLVEGDSVYNGSLQDYSWGNLFIKSYLWDKDTFEYLKKEIKAQIYKVDEVVSKCIDIAETNHIPVKQKGIRIDSHVHTHLIPIVWKALIEVIQEEKLNVEFIRNPKEPIVPFFKQKSLVPKYNVVNMVKNRILMFYSGKVDRYCRKNDMDTMYMWGLIMSGEMDIERISKIYPDMEKYCERHKRPLEILFHPGLALKEEDCVEMNPESSKAFNMSDNRKIENKAVRNIKTVIDRG
ncbi:MAG: ChbG/HpnK family deacetylase [Erysipelotrichaceae bacterium]|nr:ChbG/HpnK family deacetylase [Erysipelotrichaceae bacterium]